MNTGCDWPGPVADFQRNSEKITGTVKHPPPTENAARQRPLLASASTRKAKRAAGRRYLLPTYQAGRCRAFFGCAERQGGAASMGAIPHPRRGSYPNGRRPPGLRAAGISPGSAGGAPIPTPTDSRPHLAQPPSHAPKSLRRFQPDRYLQNTTLAQRLDARNPNTSGPNSAPDQKHKNTKWR